MRSKYEFLSPIATTRKCRRCREIRHLSKFTFSHGTNAFRATGDCNLHVGSKRPLTLVKVYYGLYVELFIRAGYGTCQNVSDREWFFSLSLHNRPRMTELERYKLLTRCARRRLYIRRHNNFK